MSEQLKESRTTESDLKEAFWQLYTQYPIENISVKAVSEVAGYSRGTFYLHFTDVYNLRNVIESELIGKLRTCVETCMKDLDEGADPHDCVVAVLDFYRENKMYLNVLLGTKGDPQFLDELKRNIKPLWSRYVLKRDVATLPGTENSTCEVESPEDDLVVEYSLSGALFMISRWINHPSGVSDEKLLHLIYHFAFGR